MNVILKEKLHKPEFMKIFTDLPFLVNKKTGKMIRRTDMEKVSHEHHHAAEEEFYCMNKKTRKPARMPGTEGNSEHKTLRLKEFGIDPELSGSWNIKDKDGKEIQVTTVYDLMYAEAMKFSPEETQATTGVHPDTVRVLAHDIAIPKVVEITTGFSLNKYFNGILSIWNISSILGLTGRMGPYGGLNTENEFTLSGLGALSGFQGKYAPRFGSGFVGEFIFGDGMKTFNKYFSDEDVNRAHDGHLGNDKLSPKAEYQQIIDALLKDGENDHKNKEAAKHGTKGNVVKPWWIPTTALIVADSKFRRNKVRITVKLSCVKWIISHM